MGAPALDVLIVWVVLVVVLLLSSSLLFLLWVVLVVVGGRCWWCWWCWWWVVVLLGGGAGGCCWVLVLLGPVGCRVLVDGLGWCLGCRVVGAVGCLVLFGAVWCCWVLAVGWVVSLGAGWCCLVLFGVGAAWCCWAWVLPSPIIPLPQLYLRRSSNASSLTHKHATTSPTTPHHTCYNPSPPTKNTRRKPTHPAESQKLVSEARLEGGQELVSREARSEGWARRRERRGGGKREAFVRWRRPQRVANGDVTFTSPIFSLLSQCFFPPMNWIK